MIPMGKGLDNFHSSRDDSCSGAMLIAPLKPNGQPRPVQIPDMFRAIVTSFLCGLLSKGKDAINFLETGAGRTDYRNSQRGLSKDGCTYVVKEVQRLLETADVLSPGLVSPDSYIDLKLDITEFFPSGNRQLLFDMIAGVASCDYPHTNIKKGDLMPSHPCFRLLLPLVVALYGKKSLLSSFHPSREKATVPFTTGWSQGDGSASFCAGVVARFASDMALVPYPDIPVIIKAIMDDFHILGLARYLGPLFITLSNILLDCLGLKVNLTKSSLNLLQAASIVNPSTDLLPLLDHCPGLENFPISTEGFVCVGTPIGHPSFIREFMQHKLEDLNTEFQKLLPYPYPHDFLLLVRYCCNQKIMHLLRHLGPQILDYAEQFDSLIEKLIDSYFDLHLSPSSPLDLSVIPSNLPSLTLDHMAQLARVQLRGLSSDGGLDLLSMRDVAIPAFYAAHMRHFRRLLDEGVSGPFLLPDLSLSVSSSLFSQPFLHAHSFLLSQGAVSVFEESDIHPPMVYPKVITPDLSLFQQQDPHSSLSGVSKLLPKLSIQKSLSSWVRSISPSRNELLRLREAYPSLDSRLTHLSPVQYTGSHKPFDSPSNLVMSHQPNAFLKTLLPLWMMACHSIRWLCI